MTVPAYKHILDSTRALFLFGTPHGGLRTEELERMVEDLASGEETSSLMLLRQLREDSDFLQNQRESVTEVLKAAKIYSFYETRKTKAVSKV
jgi:hypothetical protein